MVTLVGTGYLRNVNSSRVYVRLEDVENRVFSFSRLVEKTLEGRPQDAFHGVYSQRDVMDAVRERLKRFHGPARPRRQHPDTFHGNGSV